jgi:AcrR family transcriptional regulator
MPHSVVTGDARVDSHYNPAAMAKRPATIPRKLPRQPRSRATVEALVGAAAQVLVRDGYEKASVNVIAKRAGCSIGSLYQYFPTKEALIAEVLRVHAQRVIETFMSKMIAFAHVPVREAVRGVIACILDAFALDPALLKVIVEQVPRTGQLARSKELEEQIALMLRGYLEFHRDELAIENVDMAVKILIHGVDGVATAMVVEDPALARRDELAGELTAMVLRYVAK